MGSVSNAISNPADIGNLALSVYSLGAYGKGGYLINTGKTQKEEQEEAEKEQLANQPKSAIDPTGTKAPDAEMVDPNAIIMANQKSRRKHLLFQSTGREQAQGPTIETKTNKNNLF